MIELIDQGALMQNGKPVPQSTAPADPISARRGTMAYQILEKHNTGKDGHNLRLRFDALASHDITYVGIVQTARASGLSEFPVPYALTNCHNSLCAVGGTINEDDHIFGLSAAKKYGGFFVPPHLAVIHQYVREMMTASGSMILGSDSHTRYGPLGTMGFGEGGPELVKQILRKTYDIPAPGVIAVYLEGKPAPGVGPQDVALAIIGAVFKNGFVKNKIMEFVGPGIGDLSIDYRNGIDVMTTETTCLSSIWMTDDKVREYFALHGRSDAYRKLEPEENAYYDGMIRVNLSAVVPMIALPFHPSNAYPIAEVNANPGDFLRMIEQEAGQVFENSDLDLNLTSKIRNGRLAVDQGIIAGCAGGSFENICDAAAILKGKTPGSDAFSLSVYPASQPIYLELVKNGAAASLMETGAVIKTAFCGPCFGAGDTPSHGALSIRHATRNFPNREGSKPGEGQIASVALMDARSIAATAAAGGVLTAATEIGFQEREKPYQFDASIYKNRVYAGFGQPDKQQKLVLGPNITDWPEMSPLPKHLLLQVASVIRDPVTTTDELIPSGETSSLRSNPLRLAEFALSRKDPGYVERAKAVHEWEKQRLANPDSPDLFEKVQALCAPCTQLDLFAGERSLSDIGIGSMIFANKPGDGSAREQAASSQKVLGGWANAALEYATKRYRSNLINWGMLPLIVRPEDAELFQVGGVLLLPDIRNHIKNASPVFDGYLLQGGKSVRIPLTTRDLTDDERAVILAGSLINFYNIG